MIHSYSIQQSLNMEQPGAEQFSMEQSTIQSEAIEQTTEHHATEHHATEHQSEIPTSIGLDGQKPSIAELESEIKALKARDATLQKINHDLERQIICQAQALSAARQELKHQQYLFQPLVEKLPDIIVRYDRQLRCIYVNPVVFQECGIEADAMIGKHLSEFKIPQQVCDLWTRELQQVFLQKKQGCFEFSYQSHSSLQSYQVLVIPELERRDEVESVIAVIHNVTAFKNKETQFFQALHEKEIFLQEIHHRIKNNMQMVSSLLNLQAGSITSSSLIDSLSEAQSRIQAMALIHEQLCQSSTFSHINFRDYAEQLAYNLLQSYHQDNHCPTLHLDIANVDLAMNQAIPCGLIMNELITNAFKYAFPNQSAGEIHCIFQQDDNQMCSLTVSDSGVGLPIGVDIYHTDSLGFQLVTALAAKLRGTLEVDRRTGSRFVLQFMRV
ncbi:histidine kinase dimerization/phosphoacceptor domain -containing protein [Alkalinema pantanalense CENA528]|uniref:PAS domain-containing sensor histidine kinase n=1 Tax=Alkalinema pantanalense TaxID=1620705 RepID=UPI003D6DBC2D